jgi:hypothetical protein
MSHLNVYPDPNTGGCYLKFSRHFRENENFRQNFRKNENFRENKTFHQNFRESENFRETKFREKWANFRLFSLFAKMKRGFRFNPADKYVFIFL